MLKGKRVRRSPGIKDIKLSVVLSNNAEMLILEELLGITKISPRISRNGLISRFLMHSNN